MKQKLIALLAVLGLLLALTGCQNAGNAGQETAQAQVDTMSDQAEQKETAEETTPDEETVDSAETADQAEATAPADTGDTSDTLDSAGTADSVDAAEQTQADTAAQPSEADTAPLTELLGQIRENVWVGTAGSSLKAATQAAALLDWGAETSLTTEQIQAAVQDWYTALAADEQSEALEQLDAVAAAIGELTGENGADLLDSAGCTDSGYPWNDQAISAAQAAMTAVSDSAEG